MFIYISINLVRGQPTYIGPIVKPQYSFYLNKHIDIGLIIFKF